MSEQQTPLKPESSIARWGTRPDPLQATARLPLTLALKARLVCLGKARYINRNRFHHYLQRRLVIRTPHVTR